MQLQQAADRLWQADTHKTLCAPVRDLIGSDDLKAAYAVQQINHQKRLAAGAQVVGYKIGLTSKAVQSQLGVDQPDYGVLYHDRQLAADGSIEITELLQPKVETEVAFVLAEDLPQQDLSMAQLEAAIDYALISLEIVGSRIANWDIHITDTIADNASASHFVLGEKAVQLDDFDLINCKMEMNLNGELVSTGTGGACLGSPLNAALWLARQMAELGKPLRAGHVLLSGALGPVTNVVTGDTVHAAIDGLGEVSVTFE
ncbi:MAG: fumarylacetoacetate hydrolase family protein [Bacteroidota bacterium]